MTQLLKITFLYQVDTCMLFFEENKLKIVVWHSLFNFVDFGLD